MKVIAKFQCIDNAPVEGEQKRMYAIPVTSGSEENKSFSRWTPSGQLELIISNETEAADYLQPGDEFYLTIEKCHQNPNFAVSGTQPDVEDLAPESVNEEIEEQPAVEEIKPEDQEPEPEEKKQTCFSFEVFATHDAKLKKEVITAETDPEARANFLDKYPNATIHSCNKIS